MKMNTLDFISIGILAENNLISMDSWRNFKILCHSIPHQSSYKLSNISTKIQNSITGHKVMAKKPRVGWFENFTLLAITLWPMVGLSCSLAQSIAVDVRNRMVYGLAWSDQFKLVMVNFLRVMKSIKWNF